MRVTVLLLISSIIAATTGIGAVIGIPEDVQYGKPRIQRVDAGEALAPIDGHGAAHLLAKRNSPTGTYAPGNVTCPQGVELIRHGLTLSEKEVGYVDQRFDSAQESLKNWLSARNVSFDTSSLFANNTTTPRLAAAFSGGGYRAMLNGAGVLSALDERTTAKNKSMGGLLQSAMYLSGLSGGNWMLGSVAVNGFATVQNMSESVWDLEKDILTPGGWNVFSTGSYYDDLYDEVEQKKDAGFNVSLTDYWGRALSRQLVNATAGGPAITFSSIQNETWFKNAEFPFPIVIADGREPDELAIALNTTVWEFTPYEFGSWDNDIETFVALEYLGTNFQDGQAPNNRCVMGFDNAGFVMGTSSSLFNEALLQINGTGDSIIKDAIEALLGDIGEDNDDIAVYVNPFEDYSDGNFTVSSMVRDQSYLDLVDGGEDGQNIPLWPLLHEGRAIDVILAVDSSADTDYHWPNGTSMVATYERVTEGEADLKKHIPGFPYVPDQNTFVNNGYNLRPTFFGCNGSNTTSGNLSVPLIIYLPNAPWSYNSNTSTYKLEYDRDAQDAMIENGFAGATQGNSSHWATCVACAIVQRSYERLQLTQPDECQKCFEEFCWDGSTNSSEPSTSTVNQKINSWSDHTGASGAAGLNTASLTLLATSLVASLALL